MNWKKKSMKSDKEDWIFFGKAGIGLNCLKDKYFSYILLGLCLAFYLFFSIFDGYVWCADTNTYVSMSIAREPLYPLYLAFFRALIGGETRYLLAAVIGQGLLLGWAIWILSTYLHKVLKTPRFLYVVMVMCSLGVSLLCRFAARRGSMYSNSILSEGLAIPLFLIFFRFLYEYAITQSRKSMIWTLILSVLLIATRKQMFISVALFGIVYFVCKVKEGKWFQGIWKGLLCAIAVVAVATVFDCATNYFVHGSFVRHANDNRFILTMVFFEADREDGEKIENEEIRELFYQIYDDCEEAGYFAGRYGKDWYERSTLFANHYDHIQLDTMYPAIQEYVIEKNQEGIQVNLGIDEVGSQIMDAVLPCVLGKMVITSLDNIMNGLMTTVAVKMRILIPYVYGILVLYVVLLCYLWKTEGWSNTTVLATLILLAVIVNVCMVALVIFSQSRYTIYNMPLFYIGGCVMLYQIVMNKLKKQ